MNLSVTQCLPTWNKNINNFCHGIINSVEWFGRRLQLLKKRNKLQLVLFYLLITNFIFNITWESFQ